MIEQITKTVNRCTCEWPDCRHRWESDEIPGRCAKCKQRNWDKRSNCELQREVRVEPCRVCGGTEWRTEAKDTAVCSRCGGAIFFAAVAAGAGEQGGELPLERLPLREARRWEWRGFRQRYSLSQAELGKLLGISRRAVQFVEAAQAVPRAETLGKFAALQAKRQSQGAGNAKRRNTAAAKKPRPIVRLPKPKKVRNPE